MLLKVERENLISTVGKMKAQGYTYLVIVTAVDYSTYIDVVYILRNIDAKKEEILEINLDPKDAWVPTIMDIHKSADWYEREMSEMFGIFIRGRNTPRLLLEKWDGIDPPLRKTFQWDTPYRTSETVTK